MKPQRPLLYIGSWLLLAACRPSPARESRDFERMRVQQRYDAYGPSAYFANRAVLQAPPAHTVPRDSLPAADGARQFAISCAPCHGDGGFGGGPMAPNMPHHPPSLQELGTKLTRDQVVAVITGGFGHMPPLGWQMPPATRGAVADYVARLHAVPRTPATVADSTLATYLHKLDSIQAAGGDLRAVLQLRAGGR